MTITEKIKKIRILLLDVDGVLTDGSIYYNSEGSETKKFNVKDGLGIRLLLEKGIKVGIITGRKSEALTKRYKELGIDEEYVYQGIGSKKIPALKDILKKSNLKISNVAYVGDDLPDIPIMKNVGLSFAVADAINDIKDMADFVCTKKGGEGAVREVCDMILKTL